MRSVLLNERVRAKSEHASIFPGYEDKEFDLRLSSALVVVTPELG